MKKSIYIKYKIPDYLGHRISVDLDKDKVLVRLIQLMVGRIGLNKWHPLGRARICILIKEHI